VRAIGADGGVPWNVFEPAQLAAGVSRDALYPVDYDTSFASLDELRSTGDLEIWSSYGEAVQMLSSGRVDMVRMSTAPFFDLIQSGDVAVSWAEPICSLDSIEIVGNTEQYEEAMAFIEFQAQPERQAEYAILSHNGPITPEAFEFIPDDIEVALPGSPDTAANIVWSDNQWYGENYDEMVERWNEWVTG
jgi:putative spermidine/putrescine transport system substrate-binding protein